VRSPHEGVGDQSTSVGSAVLTDPFALA